MSKVLNMHAAQRVDLEDLLYSVDTFPRGEISLANQKQVLDNQSRILHGFRLEIPDQDLYPGRITVHGGYGLDATGQRVYSDTYPAISRTTTLEGAGLTFYVEIEFSEVDSDSDARAFWDPTVDQGTDISGDALPNGQEFSDTIATRKILDWKIVTPISTTAFERTTVPTSTKIPLVKLAVSGAGKITNTTAKASTVILQVIATAPVGILRVQDAQHFQAGYVIPYAGSTPGSAVAVGSTDVATGIITLSGSIGSSHVPGDLLLGSGATAVNLIPLGTNGRYGRIDYVPSILTDEADQRDLLFQGEEYHGHILANGPTIPGYRTDAHLKTLKDYVDFLAAQIEELKWGATDPYTLGTSSERNPPGVATVIPTYPRYYHQSSSVNGAKTATVTVGNGTTSWGDFCGTGSAAIQAAIDALPVVGGGKVYLKPGYYSLTANVNVTKAITLEMGPNTTIRCDGGYFHIATTDEVKLLGLTIEPGITAPSYVGIRFDTLVPSKVTMEGCLLTNVAMEISSTFATESSVSNCKFYATDTTNFATRSLITATAGVCGVWRNCRFLNTGMTSGAGACIDANTAYNLRSVKFVDCEFDGIGTGATVSSLIRANTPSSVNFTRCVFNSSVGLASYFESQNGLNVTFTDCFDAGAYSALIVASDLVGLTVSKYENRSAGNCTIQIYLTNCNKVDINNCTLRPYSVTLDPSISLTLAPIKIVNSNGTIINFSIKNNYIVASTDYITGIMFDIATGGDSIKNVALEGNTFDHCEVGAYLDNSSVSSGVLESISFLDNSFQDFSGTVGLTADYQKVGIIATANSYKYGWNISHNRFNNLNPANTNTVAGIYTRNAIKIMGTLNYRFEIKNNIINEVGDYSNAQTGVSAIFAQCLNRSEVCGNIISEIGGTGMVAGIHINDGSGTSKTNVVSDNVFFALSAPNTNDEIYGITGTILSETTIKDNVLYSTNATLGFVSAVFGVNDDISSVLTKVTLKNNTYPAEEVRASGIYISAYQISSLIVEGNNIGPSATPYLNGIYINCSSGGYANNVSVLNNTLVSYLANGIIVNTSATSGVLNIANNTLNMASAGSGANDIHVHTAKYVGISDNVCAHLSTNSYGLRTEAVTWFRANNNIFSAPATSIFPNIYLYTGTGHGTCSSNTCEGGASGGAYSIDSFSAGVGTGPIKIHGNGTNGTGTTGVNRRAGYDEEDGNFPII
jgi:hypothetical protein